MTSFKLKFVGVLLLFSCKRKRAIHSFTEYAQVHESEIVPSAGDGGRVDIGIFDGCLKTNR